MEAGRFSSSTLNLLHYVLVEVYDESSLTWIWEYFNSIFRQSWIFFITLYYCTKTQHMASCSVESETMSYALLTLKFTGLSCTLSGVCEPYLQNCSSLLCCFCRDLMKLELDHDVILNSSCKNLANNFSVVTSFGIFSNTWLGVVQH